eukprot:scaffold213971_cov31-Tisochrysis_lutea.AAC.4
MPACISRHILSGVRPGGRREGELEAAKRERAAKEVTDEWSQERPHRPHRMKSPPTSMSSSSSATMVALSACAPAAPTTRCRLAPPPSDLPIAPPFVELGQTPAGFLPKTEENSSDKMTGCSGIIGNIKFCSFGCTSYESRRPFDCLESVFRLVRFSFGAAPGAIPLLPSSSTARRSDW